MNIAVVTTKKKPLVDEDDADYSNPPAKIKRDAFKYVASGKTGPNVGCKSCFYYDSPDECELFEMLNERMPEAFELDKNVAPNAGCKAHIAKEKHGAS